MALMTYAQAAALALMHEMQADASVVVVGEDVGRGGIFGQYQGLQSRFGGQRVIDTPISEAAILGAGVGMALAGLRPVVEMRVVDFALCGMDEIVNQAAKNRFMFGGQGRVPLVARMPIGIWDSSAAQHSQSLESWFAHLPGVVVVCPATPQDNYSLLRASLASGDPVVYMEHKTLWGLEGEVDEQRHMPARPGPHRSARPAPHAGELEQAVAGLRPGLRATGARRRRRRTDRPAHHLALGPRHGAAIVRAHRASRWWSTRRCRPPASAPRSRPPPPSTWAARWPGWARRASRSATRRCSKPQSRVGAAQVVDAARRLCAGSASKVSPDA